MKFIIRQANDSHLLGKFELTNPSGSLSQDEVKNLLPKLNNIGIVDIVTNKNGGALTIIMKVSSTLSEESLCTYLNKHCENETGNFSVGLQQSKARLPGNVAPMAPGALVGRVPVAGPPPLTPYPVSYYPGGRGYSPAHSNTPAAQVNTPGFQRPPTATWPTAAPLLSPPPVVVSTQSPPPSYSQIYPTHQ